MKLQLYIVLLFAANFAFAQTVVKQTPTNCVNTDQIFYFPTANVTSWTVMNGGTQGTHYTKTIIDPRSVRIRWTTGFNNISIQVSYIQNGVTKYASSSSFNIYNYVTPTVSLGAVSPSNVCSGSSITLTASGTNGGTSPSYSWYVDNQLVGTSSTNSFSYSTASLAAGSHSAYVKLTSSFDCLNSNPATSGSQNFTVTGKASYTVTLDPPSMICSGSQASYHVSVGNPVGNLTYTWYRNGSVVTDRLSGTPAEVYVTTVAPTEGTTVYCVVSSDYWCVNSPVQTSTHTVHLTAPQTPTASINIPKLQWCNGESITFSGSMNNNPGGSVGSVVWKLNGVTLSSSPGTFTLPVNTDTSLPNTFSPGDVVTLEMSGITGTCITSSTAQATTSGAPITITAIPSAAITGVNVFCSGSSVTLSAAGGMDQYIWYKGGIQIASGSMSSISVSTPGAYEVWVSKNTCTNTTPTPHVLSLYPNLTAGSISSPQVICYDNDVAAFTSVAASGGNGTYAYQWEWRSPGGLWAPLSGATGATYDHSTLTQTKEFRRQVTSCTQSAVTNPLTVTVYPDLNAGSISAPQTICYGANVAAFESIDASGGNGTYSYQWQSRLIGGNWGNINGATGATYDHETLTVTTEFQRIVTSCGQTKSTDPIRVTVRPDLSGGAVGYGQTICYNADVAAFSSIAGASGGDGTYTYQWQWRTPGGTWSNVPGPAISVTYDHAALTETKEFQRLVSSCNQTKPSSPVTVTVRAALNAATISSSQTICYNTDVAAFSASAPTGGDGNYTYQWQWRSTGGTFADVPGPGTTGATYDYGQLTETKDFQRLVTSCGQTLPGNAITVTVRPDLNAGAIGSNQTISFNANVAAFSSSADASGGDATYNYQWQWRSPDGLWSNVPGTATGATYDHDALTETKEFQRLVTSCGQTKPTSGVTVTVNPPYIQLNGSDVIPPGGATQIVATSGLYSYEWLRNNEVVADATTNILTVKKPGVYKARVKGSATGTIYSTGELTIGESLKSQFSNVTHLITTTFLDAGVTEQTDVYDLNPEQYSINVQYVDGIGRPMMNVGIGQSPSRKDVVQIFEYDEFGREAVKHLSYTRSSDGRYFATGRTEQESFYANTAMVAHDDAFAKTIFEASPLNRIIEQGAAGAAWQPDDVNDFTSTDHTMKYAYEYNTSNEVLRWTLNYPAGYPLGIVNVNFIPGQMYYAANQIQKKKTKDSDGKVIIEYVDKQGRTILRRVQAVDNPASINDTDYASTYYIYDDFGNLVCVIPPQAVKELATKYYQSGATDLSKNEFLKRWAFRYAYDGKMRMTQKQVPGAKPVYMVYDSRDRLVLTQDGNQRGAKWTFIKYDLLNRPVLTGIYNNTDSLQVVQNAVDAYYAVANPAWGETYVGDIANDVLGYNNASFPQISNESSYLTATYYDRYDSYIKPAAYEYQTQLLPGQLSQPRTTNILGLVTATLVRNLEDYSYWLRTVNYYDNKLRVIQTVSTHQKGMVRTGNVLDFSGKVLYTKRDYTVNSVASSVKETFTYDHAGRALTTKHSINGGTEYTLTKNEYNELGQLVDKKLHSSDGNSFQQSVDYRYNIRGWLLSINNASLANDGTTNNDTGDYFGMELIYDQLSAIGNTPAFNGNITGTAWSNNLGLGTIKMNGTVYSYDAMNRLNGSTFKEKTTASWTASPNSAFAETGITYDLNGNISTLARNDKRASGTMDILSYTYESAGSNKLVKVTDAGDINTGFKDGASGPGNDYAYDANGNMISDLNKSVSSIQYNHLNLPRYVSNGTADITYAYDASGRKLTQKVSDLLDPINNKETEYIGDYVYENGVLQFVNHAEGRIVMTGATPEYQYHLKDHLGNVRMTFTSKVETVSETSTLETANLGAEQSKFLRYNEAVRVQATMFDHTNGSSTGYSERLNGTANEKYGIAKSLSVMPGDVIKTEVFVKYADANSANWNTALTNLMTAIANNTGGIRVEGSNYNNSTSSFGQGNLVDKSGSTGTAPKAYLTWIVFDRNYVMKDGGYVRVTEAARETGTDIAHEKLFNDNIVIKEPGYVYIYLSNENETPVEVFFDDFKVEYVKSPIVQMDDYYPFGLSFNSYKRENTVDQNFKYNGKEVQDELDLGWIDYGARMYMPEIGRWGVIDLLAPKFPSYSPYNYALNNPIYFIDQDGLAPEPSKNRAVGVKAYIQALKAAGVNSLESMHVYHGGGGTTSARTVNVGRYIYSEKWGWADMRHVSSMAYRADFIIYTAHGTLKEGERKESNQLWSLSPAENSSAYDYEDLTSNLLGVAFESYLEGEDAEGKDFLTNLETYLTELGFVDDPTTAPNYSDLEETNDTDSGEQNFTYYPSHTRSALFNRLDRQIQKQLRDFMGKQDNRGFDRRRKEDKQKMDEDKKKKKSSSN